MEPNVRGKSMGALKNAPRLFRRHGVLNDQFNPLMPRQIADDLAIDPRDRLKLPRPIAAIMGPSEPRCRMRLPLGRHAVAEGGGQPFGIS